MGKKRWLLIGTGAAVIVYSVVVLAVIATSPDLRVRCLLVDQGGGSGTPPGVEIIDTPNLTHQGPRPEPGDILVSIRGRPIRNFLDFTGETSALYDAEVSRADTLEPGSDPSELAAWGLSPLLRIEDGPKVVRVAYWSRATGVLNDNCWLPLQPLGTGEILLSIVWFLLQTGVFLVGAIAFWYRPHDRPVRLFFAMTIVAMGAFAGIHHWWMLCGSLWLLLPFTVCVALLPAVTLHFFLVYPRAKPPIRTWPGATLAGLYGVPIVFLSGLLIVFMYAHWLNSEDVAGKHAELVNQALGLMRSGVYGYLSVAGVYFLLTVVALVMSFYGSRKPIERAQMKWILWAGLASGVPIIYVLYLAHFDRVRLALGGATVPLFIASLSFMLAYAVGVVRYKLMLVDELVSKGMLYYATSIGLAVVFAIVVTAAILLQPARGIALAGQQLISVGALALLSILLLLWLRDRFQQMIDQRFFREKYQLDRTLRRINRVVGQVSDPEALGAMMLESCRDALQVDRAGLYWRGSPQAAFQLVAAEGAEDMPISFTADPTFLSALREGGNLQRVPAGAKSRLSPAQSALRVLGAELVHALEMDEGVFALVVLGRKRNGASFSAEDLAYLHALGQIANVALHSARVHQNLSRLNEELRQKIERIGSRNRQISALQDKVAEGPVDARTSATPRQGEFRREAIKGSSPAIGRVLETVRKVASSESSVLILGESGTGKELLARILHENSPRRSRSLVSVHCASLSPGLLESELFGHVKGAFTGAHRDKIGRFEAADGGTLFLDEIGDISLETQVKLLRVLQERCFQPVGSTRTVHVDVRLVAATHQNLEQLIAAGRFREDLYYRLNVISITMPSLRERKEDVFEMAWHFLNRATSRINKRITHIDETALAALESYHWPGNVRELENVIERAVVLADGDSITFDELPAEVKQASTVHAPPPIETRPVASVARSTTPDGANEAERQRLQEALHRCGGNKAQAARMLGMARSTYFSKLKKHALD